MSAWHLAVILVLPVVGGLAVVIAAALAEDDLPDHIAAPPEVDSPEGR